MHRMKDSPYIYCPVAHPAVLELPRSPVREWSGYLLHRCRILRTRGKKHSDVVLPGPISQRWYIHTLWSFGSVYMAFFTRSNSLVTSVSKSRFALYYLTVFDDLSSIQFPGVPQGAQNFRTLMPCAEVGEVRLDLALSIYQLCCLRSFDRHGFKYVTAVIPGVDWGCL